MKQGTNLTLPIEFKELDFTKVDTIEFLFKQINSDSAPALKKALWVNGNENETAYKPANKNEIYIVWTMAETYEFKSSAPFFLDTRIHIKNSNDNPNTPILTLHMDATLFGEGEVVE